MGANYGLFLSDWLKFNFRLSLHDRVREKYLLFDYIQNL